MSETTDHNIQVTYSVRCSAALVEIRAEALLLEQSVELPRAALRHPWVTDHIVGDIAEINQVAPDNFLIRISHPLVTSALDPAQLLNVIFGNSSLQPDVMLEDVELPEIAFATFRGPRFGIDGLRRLAGAPQRPLSCTALKPMGLPAPELAELCRTFALAGVDFIKDDHGLADHPFCPFEERVAACQRALQAVERDTGQRACYVPNLIGTPDTVLRQLAVARDHGVAAVMISPMLTGLPLLHQLANQESSLPILAHPAFAGALRIAPPTLLGRIFRWFGADAVIYPHFGGRFSYDSATCGALADALRRTEGPLRPALPVPAGGIAIERIPELVEFYGPDVMFLVGGSLYAAGDRLLERTGEFTGMVRSATGERRQRVGD